MVLFGKGSMFLFCILGFGRFIVLSFMKKKKPYIWVGREEERIWTLGKRLT